MTRFRPNEPTRREILPRAFGADGPDLCDTLMCVAPLVRDMAVWVLGDQLSRTHGPLAARPNEPVLMIESRAFARRYPYHPHKLTLVFSAMRHFRDELREAGYSVDYRTADFACYYDGLVESGEEGVAGIVA